MRTHYLTLTLFSLALVGCCKPDPEADKKASARTAAYVESMKGAHASLSGTLPRDGEACPALKAPEGSTWDGYGTAVSQAELRSVVDPGGYREDAEKPWAWMSSGPVREIAKATREGGDKGALARDQLFLAEKSPYFVVFVPSKSALPRVDGDTFHGGVWKGTMVVVDRAAGKALCRVSFAAESSSEVKHRTRGIAAKSADDALRDDLKQQIRKSASDALKTIAPTLKLSLAG